MVEEAALWHDHSLETPPAYADVKPLLDKAQETLALAREADGAMTLAQIKELAETLRLARSEIATLDHTSKALQSMMRRISELAWSDQQVRDDLRKRNNELFSELIRVKALLRVPPPISDEALAQRALEEEEQRQEELAWDRHRCRPVRGVTDDRLKSLGSSPTSVDVEVWWYDWEGRPAVVLDKGVSAWAVLSSNWVGVPPFEVVDSGRRISAEKFEAIFGDIGPPPAVSGFAVTSSDAAAD